MFTSIDTIIIVLSCTQPILICLLLTYSIKEYFYVSNFFKFFSNIRNKQLTTKFYECSTYSKLSGNFSYNIYSISTCVIFIVYDVDVVFFVPEITNISLYSLPNFLVLLLLVVLFIFGLVSDYKVLTFNWIL